MAAEADTQNLIQSNFRRASLTDHGVEKIPAARIPGIFGQMGQKYDSKKLTQWMEKLDAKKTGFLDHESYNKLCKEFVTAPAAQEMLKGDEFSFKHQISLPDFAKP